MSNNTGLQSVAGQWSVLRGRSGARESLDVHTLPLEITTPAGPIRLAVGSHGEARLLVPLKNDEIPNDIDAGQGLAVSTTTFTLNAKAQRFLDIMCLSLELEEVFGNVVNEIVKRVKNGTGRIEAVRTTVADYRLLLAARILPNLDRSLIVGLIAELLTLNKLLEISSSAWRTWRGPLGDRHDFRSENTSLEVKASQGVGSLVISISSIQQLEAPLGGTLHLLHYMLEPVASGLLTVSALGERALALADDPSGLRRILIELGCLDVSSDEWNKYSFRLENESLYRVDDLFPRVVPSTFAGGAQPAGVGDVTYKVDLSHASKSKCISREYDELISDLAKK